VKGDRPFMLRVSVSVSSVRERPPRSGRSWTFISSGGFPGRGGGSLHVKPGRKGRRGLFFAGTGLRGARILPFPIRAMLLRRPMTSRARMISSPALPGHPGWKWRNTMRSPASGMEREARAAPRTLLEKISLNAEEKGSGDSFSGGRKRPGLAGAAERRISPSLPKDRITSSEDVWAAFLTLRPANRSSVSLQAAFREK